MDNITLGQIIDVIIRLSALVGAVGVLVKLINNGTSKQLEKKLQPIQQSIDNVEEKIDKETLERLKSDLTTFMYLAEFGNLSSDQKLRAHEEYDMYVKMHGNSWVHDGFEKLKKENKI